jgi:hypothetical protein
LAGALSAAKAGAVSEVAAITAARAKEAIFMAIHLSK